MLAVDKTAEVWILAIVALVERARMHGESGQIIFIVVSWSVEALVFVEALLLSSH